MEKNRGGRLRAFFERELERASKLHNSAERPRGEPASEAPGCLGDPPRGLHPDEWNARRIT
jgi:hypothetical protein